ncbi:MAG TPA: zinc ribbon domain-containing protein [Methanocella sp.]|uniref:zinc ribbon domain-containing protein n=1 Tax=Methanocella sp. TaxID=2052833 RepID=UPI002B7690F4|nr:zinc ribbon domain-containing protein [Methanocella sp.]HTY91588.1 zinc ribbon domain-containing protein [Methanocella sp.]
MNMKAVVSGLIGAVIILIGLFAWFLTLMALISGASWAVYMGLAGLLLVGIGAAFVYIAYTSTQQDKMGDARYHNMERQVLALAKKNKGTVTVADLINAGFESDEAERVLDKMSRKGICDINLDATEASGITTYSFPTLIPFGQDEKTAKV